jgi:uncharacterized protein YndB with AHSA1/START domain/uncharacterized protein YciI
MPRGSKLGDDEAHRVREENQVTEAAPIRREITVDLDARDAFELFTAGIGEWWPIAELGVFGEGASVAFAAGRIVETFKGQTSEWGTVTEWAPGERLSFTWHPGAPAEQASAVTVTFTLRDAGQTLVVLEHSGWEVYDDPEAARREYGNGWPRVLDRYRRAATANGDVKAYTWVALLHRAGPGAPKDRSVFEDPRFSDHVRFLTRMCEEGYLVAAGPMLDEMGAGMTILRLPGEGRLEEVTAMARTEDMSVKAGLFEVTVRPWQVMMSGER